jgi:endonuclease/exonuclease/phosphatase family metal-dependent hydrolase
VPTRFRLATFNLENLDCAPCDDGAFERRLAVLRPVLSEIAADILCLQEIDAQKDRDGRGFLALDRLFAGGPYEAFHRATSVRPGGTAPADVHNLVIASRWPIVGQRQLHHDIVARWRWIPPAESSSPHEPVEVAWDRPLLYARIAVPDGALHLVNLHLRAPRAVPLHVERPATAAAFSRAYAEGQFLAAQKREGQALEARLFVERLFDAEPSARLAVCGDLNSEAHDSPVRILLGAPAGEGTAHSPRRLVPLAERAAKARRFSVLHGGRNVLLDHILASPALAAACVGVAILNEGLPDEVTARAPILGSLHAPVLADFDLAR